jgi:hypothetical protein
MPTNRDPYDGANLRDLARAYTGYEKRSINELRALVAAKCGDYPDGASRDDLCKLLEQGAD